MKESIPRGVERRSPMARWGRLAQDLRRAIELQEFLQGEQLPTEFELAEIYGVSRMTVRQALSAIEDEGYIERRHGQGTFVAEGLNILQHDLTVSVPWRDREESRGLATKSVQLDTEKNLAAPRSVLIDVGVQPENIGSRYFRRVQFIGDAPMGLSESWLAPQIARGIEDEPLVAGSLSRTLAEKYGVHTARVDAYVHAETADLEVSEDLNCHVDEPLVVVNELAVAQDGTVLSVSRTRWKGHLVRFHQVYVSDQDAPAQPDEQLQSPTFTPPPTAAHVDDETDEQLTA